MHIHYHAYNGCQVKLVPWPHFFAFHWPHSPVPAALGRLGRGGCRGERREPERNDGDRSAAQPPPRHPLPQVGGEFSWSLMEKVESRRSRAAGQLVDQPGKARALLLGGGKSRTPASSDPGPREHDDG
jgi:hypothetical protein